MEGASFEKIEAGASKHILQFSKFSEVRGSSGALKIFDACVCVYACACLQSLFTSSRYSRADAFANAANAAVVSLS